MKLKIVNLGINKTLWLNNALSLAKMFSATRMAAKQLRKDNE